MRVLHIVPSLDPGKGGPSKSVLGLASAQARAGAEVRIVAGASPSPASLVAEPRLEVQVERLLAVRFAIPGPPFLAALSAAIAESDVVHLHSIWNGVITAAHLLARNHGRIMLMSPRGMLDEHNIRRRGAMKKAYWRLCDQAGVQALDGIHFLDETEQQGAGWALNGDKPAIVQPNGLDLDLIGRQLEEERSSRGTPFANRDEAHLVFLGRLNVIKGLEMQVELAADLREAGLRPRLHLIGPDDGERDGLLRYARQARVSDAVTMHGPIYGHDRLRWLHDADAVLMTSHYECNSNTAAETMGVGGVLVATDTCNLDKARAAGAAVVVPRQRAALRDAVLGVLRNPQAAQAHRAAALAHAQARLDWRPLGDEMLLFYQTLLERRPSCAG